MLDTILIILEDHKNALEVARTFAPGQCEAVCAFNLKDGNALLGQKRYSAVLLDPLMCGPNWGHYLRALRYATPIPIIAVTPEVGLEVIVEIYEAGADCWLRSDTPHQHISGQTMALIRRYRQYNQRYQVEKIEVPIKYGELVIDTRQRLVFRGTTPIRLTTKEFDIFYFLVSNPNQVLRPGQIYEGVWGEEYRFCSEANITGKISVLRRKIGVPHYIETRHGAGYCFKPPQGLHTS